MPNRSGRLPPLSTLLSVDDDAGTTQTSQVPDSRTSPPAASSAVVTQPPFSSPPRPLYLQRQSRDTARALGPYHPDPVMDGSNQSTDARTYLLHNGATQGSVRLEMRTTLFLFSPVTHMSHTPTCRTTVYRRAGRCCTGLERESLGTRLQWAVEAGQSRPSNWTMIRTAVDVQRPPRLTCQPVGHRLPPYSRTSADAPIVRRRVRTGLGRARGASRRALSRPAGMTSARLWESGRLCNVFLFTKCGPSLSTRS